MDNNDDDEEQDNEDSPLVILGVATWRQRVHLYITQTTSPIVLL